MTDETQKSAVQIYFEKLILKYRYGYEPDQAQGRCIKANPYIDYEKFVEYLSERKYGTIRIYLSNIHLWNMPINEDTISKWSDSISLIDAIRHTYKTSLKVQSFMPKYKNKDPTKTANARKRLSYSIFRAMKLYLIATNQKPLLKILVENEEIKSPKSYVKKGHFNQSEFDIFISFVTDIQQKMVFELMFYTGGRVNEILNMKLSDAWIPNYTNGQTITYEENKVFELILPIGTSKTDTNSPQKLFISNQKFIKDFVEYLNTIHNSKYLFQLHPSLNPTKTYVDIAKEKNILMQVIHSIVKKPGLSQFNGKEMSIHSFRRSFINNIYNKFNKDIVFTKDLARHSDISVTGRYLESKNNELKDRLQSDIDKKDKD